MHVRIRCGSLSITTPVSLLANKFDFRIVLHGKVSLAAVNQIYLFHEAMNGCKKKSEDSLKACFRKCKYNVMTGSFFLKFRKRPKHPTCEIWQTCFGLFEVLRFTPQSTVMAMSRGGQFTYPHYLAHWLLTTTVS